MRRVAAARTTLIAAAILMAGAASPAMGQSFQTALPLDQSDRSSLERQLGPFLDRSRTGTIQQVQLPSGRQVTMRSYAPVLQAGRQPCRGYRLDLAGEDGVMAVDGFRCRRPDGAAWNIVEPETVISQSGPLDLRNSGTPAAAQPAPSTPLLGATEPQPQRVASTAAPVPRPSPLRSQQQELIAAPEQLEPVAPVSATQLPPLAQSVEETTTSLPLSEPLTPLETAVERIEDTVTSTGDALTSATTETLDSVTSETLDSATTALEPVAGASDQFAAVTGQAIERIEEGVTVLTAPTNPAPSTTVRQVADEDSDQPVIMPMSARDPAVIAALAELDYLSPGNPSAATVREAIAAFALDERFALPVPSSELRQKLNAAVDRSGTLPSCGAGAATLCIAQNRQ